MLAQATTPTPPAAVEYLYEWASLDALREQPAFLATAIAAGVLVVALTIALHRRERWSMSPLLSLWLLLLRLAAIAGVVLFLLGPQRRRAEQLVRPSRVVVLVDSSASMAMPDRLSDGADTPATRAEAAAELLIGKGLAETLGQTHRVSIAPTSAVSKAVSVGTSDGDPPTTGDKPDQAEQPPLATLAPPVGADTRLGDAINEALELYAGEPLAGIAVLSDGQSNAGADPPAAAAVAAAGGVPVATVGFGPPRAGANLIVREVVTPARAYPDDEIEVTAVVELTGDPSGSPSFSLYRRSADAEAEADVLLATESPEANAADTPAAGQPASRSLSVRFKTRPEAAGRYTYSVQAAPLPREVRVDDNRRSAVVEVVDQTTTVLLWAGGPNRDFRFLRNQLRRDDSFVVDVLLQSASGGAVQDARAVLDDFPASAEELTKYDVLVAFDPDWSGLTPDQVEVIEDWVSRTGAGFYFAPGPVNTPKWFQRGPAPEIKSLLPVSLPERVALLTPGSGGRLPSAARPVRMTRAGVDAEFLWIAGGRETSGQAWRDFPGFYRVGRTASLKPGATVFAGAGEADSAAERVVFAEQFYGAGRVFYCGASELWRLRREDPAYFTAMWTKLLRRLGQGRLLANSAGGRLLFERDRFALGETLALRTIQPGREADAPLTAQVAPPRGEPFSITLLPSDSQTGTWVARFPGVVEGRYEAEVLGADGAPLLASAEVVTPAAERDKPTRDAATLTQIAQAGGGRYYPTATAALDGAGGAPPLAELFPSREETRTVFGKVDLPFAERWSRWLLAVICGSLFLEWTTRRLASLA